MKIAVLPDVQAKPGLKFDHLTHCGKYIADKRPDVIVQIGDFAYMPSLSSYDKGKRKFEGRRYRHDIDAAQRAMDTLMAPIWAAEGYSPQLVLTLGNHENRIDRATNETPELEGLISVDDLGYAQYGWEVHPFLKVVQIGGVAFSHYFVSGVMGRPVTTASALLAKKHMSCVAGHQQGKQIAYGSKADGSTLTSIIAGSCYTHDEDYLGPQGNKHWRGMFFMHEVRDGAFDEMWLSLDYLKRRYK